MAAGEGVAGQGLRDVRNRDDGGRIFPPLQDFVDHPTERLEALVAVVHRHQNIHYWIH